MPAAESVHDEVGIVSLSENDVPLGAVAERDLEPAEDGVGGEGGRRRVMRRRRRGGGESSSRRRRRRGRRQRSCLRRSSARALLPLLLLLRLVSGGPGSADSVRAPALLASPAPSQAAPLSLRFSALSDLVGELVDGGLRRRQPVLQKEPPSDVGSCVSLEHRDGAGSVGCSDVDNNFGEAGSGRRSEAKREGEGEERGERERKREKEKEEEMTGKVRDKMSTQE